MCDFNTLSDEEKEHYHNLLLTCANNFGGKNFFLHLLEAIRATKPHPLTAKNSTFTMELGEIKWNKVIFNDKLQLLLQLRIEESASENLLPPPDAQHYKKVLNLLRTLKPIVFHIRPSDPQNGVGFFVEPFKIVDEKTTRLNPLFDALFFCSIERVKKVLNYQPKG